MKTFKKKIIDIQRKPAGVFKIKIILLNFQVFMKTVQKLLIKALVLRNLKI